MHHAARLARALLGHDAQRVFRRRTRVDDQRLLRGVRRADVGAKALALPFHIRDRAAFQAVVVEAGLADRDHLRMLGQLDEFGETRLAHILVIRMHPDRRIHVLVLAGDREDRRQRLQVDRDAQRMRHRMAAHVLEHLRQAVGESFEVDVAVRVDKHDDVLRVNSLM